MAQKIMKVTYEIYADAKCRFDEGEDRKEILKAIKHSHKVKIGMTTLRLIGKSTSYLNYCTMPKYHKNQVNHAIDIPEPTEQTKQFIKERSFLERLVIKVTSTLWR